MKPCVLENLIEFVVVQLVKDGGWGGEGEGGERDKVGDQK